jgi:Ca2+-binding EF-hand superfamily protein
MEREQAVKDENDEKLMQKFRKVFPDKSRNALSKTFAAFRKQVELKQSATSSGKMPNSFNLIEFKIAMVKGFENKFSFQEIKRIFERLDGNNSGRISVDEFIIGVRVSFC